ncbi:hypothetical protein HDK77DRAFT_58067 [Phyllosticta capitalensis]
MFWYFSALAQSFAFGIVFQTVHFSDVPKETPLHTPTSHYRPLFLLFCTFSASELFKRMLLIHPASIAVLDYTHGAPLFSHTCLQSNERIDNRHDGFSVLLCLTSNVCGVYWRLISGESAADQPRVAWSRRGCDLSGPQLFCLKSAWIAHIL